MSDIPRDIRMADMERFAELLDAVLEDAVAATLAQAERTRVALMYSAGVDSALLARICQDLGHVPLLLSLGTARSKDREFVKRSQLFLGLPIQFINVDEEDIRATLPAVHDLLLKAKIPPDVMHLSLGVGTYVIGRIARQQGVKLLLAGQGADALFAGFHKYRRVPLAELPAMLARDVETAIHKDFARDRTIATAFSLEFAAPFLAPDVVELALSIPAELKLGPAGNKLILRELARRRGLPEFIAARPKKAMQYSTGIERVVRRYCRAQMDIS